MKKRYSKFLFPGIFCIVQTYMCIMFFKVKILWRERKREKKILDDIISQIRHPLISLWYFRSSSRAFLKILRESEHKMIDCCGLFTHNILYTILAVPCVRVIFTRYPGIRFVCARFVQFNVGGNKGNVGFAFHIFEQNNCVKFSQIYADEAGVYLFFIAIKLLKYEIFFKK